MLDETGAPGSPHPQSQKSHHSVNFFKPGSAHARADMKIILSMVLIWAGAVFGFQILLMALNKPTPEANYTRYETLWPHIAGGSATPEQKREFSRVVLSVLGKNIALSEEHKATLSLTLSAIVLDLLPRDGHSEFRSAVASDDPGDRAMACQIAAETLALQATGFEKLMTDLLPTSLVPVEATELTRTHIEALPPIMDLYLIHNQSFLTDWRFLGFPFHYWYTAQFLLILFVCLCLVYALFTDRINRKYRFIEE